jgi:protein-histidine pros-kinase
MVVPTIPPRGIGPGNRETRLAATTPSGKGQIIHATLDKVNLLLVLVFAVSMAITAYVAHNFLKENARAQVIQQARLMMGAAGGMRTYTSKQVDPLLAADESKSPNFAAQRVPAYSAMEVFSYLRKDYPAYTYKEAALNPTNLRDRAADWEADVIEEFRNHAERKELILQWDTPEGPSLFLARPLTAAPECLRCHSLPAAAPASMTATYGPDHGFGWNAGEVVAAQVVSVPESEAENMADRTFKPLLISLSGVFIFTLALLDLGLIFVVVHPVDRLSRMAEEISHGNLHVPELPAKGSDEIAQLPRSFNRMSQSLTNLTGMPKPE